MQYCKIDKCPNVSVDNISNVCEQHTPTETVSYRELARRVGDIILNNQLRSATSSEFGDWELVNGADSSCYIHEYKEECLKEYHKCEYESTDTYQDYIITDSGADYLKRNTNEIIRYNEKLDVYLWGITHYGTSWDSVHTTIKA